MEIATIACAVITAYFYTSNINLVCKRLFSLHDILTLKGCQGRTGPLSRTNAFSVQKDALSSESAFFLRSRVYRATLVDEGLSTRAEFLIPAYT